MSHGLISGYQSGCRCDECREAAATARRRTRENRRRDQMVEWPDIWWTAKGACAGKDPNIWFPVSIKDEEAAVAVCVECPVMLECGDYALRIREEHGIWGALTERDRKRLLRRRGVA